MKPKLCINQFKLIPLSVTSCLLFLSCILASAQDNWTYHAQFNIGGHVNLTYGKGQKFPGTKLYGCFSVMGIHREHVVVNYAPSIAIYSKTIGANLNTLVHDIQIDFTNAVSFGYAWGGDIGYTKNYRTLHNGDFYSISSSRKNMTLLTSNIVLNNHKRHQIVGTVSGSFGPVSFYYANDGAVPFTYIPLADNFDRYWTGSGGIFIHTKQGFNRFEASFDQFTGYTPLLYELSNIIGINIPLYSESSSTPTKRNTPFTYNTSSYHAKVFLDRNYSVDVGIVGNLMSASGYHFGIQDLIHMALKMPLHPNNDMNRIFIGASYIQQSNVAK